MQKVLAAAGFGSRRACEELIETGRVTVDGETIAELGEKVDPGRQDLRVDGQRVRVQRHAYYAVHKPPGVLSTSRDPSGRPVVIDLVPVRGQRLFAVGRLDKSSEGLILVTNDGEWAQRLTHPRYGVAKTYDVMVAGQIQPTAARDLERGIRLAEGLAKAERVVIRRRTAKSSRLTIVLREGRNREIRRLLARIGHKVLRLRRVGVGPLRLGALPPGQSRRLTEAEVKSLTRAAGRASTRDDDEQHRPLKAKRSGSARRAAGRGSRKPAAAAGKRHAGSRRAARPSKKARRG